MDSLLGIIKKDWEELKKVEGNGIDDEYRRRKGALNHLSRLNSFYKSFDDRKFLHKVENIKIESPIFILGHWRSGTTLLHNLFSLDEQFGYANKFQISNPHVFLSREEKIAKRLKNARAEKRHMDNVKITFSSPDEDETAISMMCQRSPIIAWAFTRNHEKYAKYHTFEHASPADLKQWRDAMVLFYKKLTFKYQRPLVLKSPVHLGRMKILLDIFPDARFIHIYRNPYRVYQSTKKLYAEALHHTCLQRPNLEDWNRYILENYSTMYDAFWRDKAVVPNERLFEISFEEFEQDIYRHIASIYEHFHISNFNRFEPVLKKHLESIKDYKKNTFPSLPADEIEKINTAWISTFENLDYEIINLKKARGTLEPKEL